MLPKQLTIVDLFSGAGGLSLGASRAGFEVRGAVDTDPQALEAHRTNFSNARHIEADVSDLDVDSLHSAVGLDGVRFSGIIGGPPCQGFSTIGHRQVNDSRNSLFVEFFRVVAKARPTFFLAENVPGIMHSTFSSVRESALSLVSDHYTILSPMKIAANDYGAPTVRARIFFFGFLPEHCEQLTESSFLPPTRVAKVRVRDALKGLTAEVDPAWQKVSDGWRISNCHGKGYYFSRLHGHIPNGVGDPIALHRLMTECKSSGTLGTVHSPSVLKRYARLRPGEQDPVSKATRLHPDRFCPTLRAGTGPDFGSYQAVRPIHPTMPRVITPREAARLQGFPDWFTFAPSKWQSFRQIGSSVSPIVAERLLRVISRALT